MTLSYVNLTMRWDRREVPQDCAINQQRNDDQLREARSRRGIKEQGPRSKRLETRLMIGSLSRSGGRFLSYMYSSIVDIIKSNDTGF